MGGGSSETVEVRAAHDATDEERLLRPSQLPTGIGDAAGEPPEHVVEGADRPAEERGPPRQQLELDTVDVSPIRHDQHGLGPVRDLERIEVAAEQQLDLARVGRSRNEAKRHPPTLARERDAL